MTTEAKIRLYKHAGMRAAQRGDASKVHAFNLRVVSLINESCVGSREPIWTGQKAVA